MPWRTGQTSPSISSFAVKNDLLGNLPADALGVMQIKTRQHSVYAYIFERLWLHVFGLPFLKIQDNES